MKPDQGAVYLDGKELSTIRVKDSARKLAVVAQQNHYNFEFTVQEIVMMGRSPHKKALERDNAGDHAIVKEALQLSVCRNLRTEVSPRFPEGNSRGSF